MATGASAKTVDFSNVKDGGGFNKHRVPEGDYLATIVKVEDSPSKKDDVFQYLFTIQLKKHSQYKYPYYCKLQENQLWKLRNLAIAAGLNVPKKRIKFDPTKVVGKTIGVTMEDDEYEGKLQSNIAAVFPPAELMDGNLVDDEDEPEDDEEVESDEVDEVEEDEDTDTGDQFDDMDRAQLKAYIKEQDTSFQAKKSQTDDDLREIARGFSAGGDDEEDEDDEEPEPEPAPKKKATAKGKATKKKAAEVTDDELEELDIDDI